MKPSDEDSLRNWLVDYLVTNIGCSPDEVDFEASLKDLGVGSRESVVLSGELSELLDRPVSPVEFWQHPTINDLTRFLTNSESDSTADAVTHPDHQVKDEPVAVVGLGCRFPGDIVGPEAFWQFLCEGRSAVGEVPADRWSRFDDGSPEVAAALARTTRWGSFLTDIDAFDADFFDISPSEAAKMDPQQRLLLEVAYEALEHAGMPVNALRQTQTGVFVGACASEYGFLTASDLTQVDAWCGTGGALSIIANRLSYFLDLRGPSVTVDTACSSSLVAVHLACQSLRSGDSNLAIAGGVNLLLTPAITHSFDQAEALSPTGQCHAFDASADGFVRGEGCGVVVLKRLTDALRDGDPVLAVVCGSAVNQDGRSNGLMAPNPAAQMGVLRAAYANASVEPRHVDYVEAHGTGTLLGDPIEARALGRVLGNVRPPANPLLIGAVKSNLGHLEGAAGIAGFIKAVLAVRNGRIPANLNFEKPNPHIPFEKLRLKVVAEATDWPETGQPRRAGVSSFGFGGTNAHVVLEQHSDVLLNGQTAPQSPSALTTLVISGKNAERVASTAETLAEWMEGSGAAASLADVAHTLNHHRSRQPKFATVAALDREQAVAGLRALGAGRLVDGVVGPHQGNCRPGTVFVYSGQGSQWAGMGRQLLNDEPVFAAALAELESTFTEEAGFSLWEVLAGGEPVVGIDRIQPVLVATQLALTKLWRSYGVEPDAVIGHSMGEVTAAVVAGGLSVRDGLRVISTRSRLMARLSGQGAMALLELDPASAEALIAEYPGVTLAVYASPRQSVIAGPPELVDAVIAVVAAQERLARRIEVDVASHHPIIDPVLPELRTALAGLTPRRPTIPMITTVCAETAGGTINFDAAYWSDNLRKPVRFSHAVAAAGADYGTFVEVSPHPVLTYAISDTLDELHHHSIGTLQRDTHDTLTFHTNLNATHTVEPPKTDHPAGPSAVLPTSPWHRTRHWVARKERVDTGSSAPKVGTLLGAHIAVATTPPAQLWQSKLVAEAKPYPGFHRIHGVEVVPVSVLLQTLSAAAAESGVPGLSDVRFEHPIVVDRPRLVQVVAEGESVTVLSRATTDSAPCRWTTHVSARLSPFAGEAVDPGVDELGQSDNGAAEGGETRTVAELLDAWGIEGQPFPWSIESFRRTSNGTSTGIVAGIALAEASPVGLLDAAVHVARLVDGANPRLMVPSAVENVWLSSGSCAQQAFAEVRQLPGGADEIVVDITIKAPDGAICAEIRSLRYVDVESRATALPSGDSDPRSASHTLAWRPWRNDSDAMASEPGALAIVGSAGPASVELRVQLADAGYTRASVAEARYVIYLAEPGDSDADVDSASVLSAEVADLVRQLAERDEQHPATLWIITCGVREPASDKALQQSPLWGLAAVIGAEHPELWGGLVDVSAEDNVGDYAAKLSSVLLTPAKTVLAFHDGEFLAPAMVPISGQPVREPLRCEPDAAYLITGGMGALGELMANWLADHGARRLVLAGRTPLPRRRDWDKSANDTNIQRTIAAIRGLERRGVSVEAVALDVGSRDAVEALVARRDGDGAPPIRGVIHAAGVTENKLVSQTTESTLRRVMWPKIAGAQALHQVFPPGQLDFLFLTASAGAVFGVPGQGAYAAANAYLDCLARARHQQGCHSVSLDWVAWQGLGFAADAKVTIQELARLGSRPVSAEEAFAAWEFVHRHDVAQAVIAPMASATPQGSEQTNGHRASATAWSEMSADDMTRELEAGLRTVLTRELRLPESELESDRPFAEMGLNSVMAMSIRREVEQLAGIELSATMLWNHPTIGSLTAFLVQKLTPADAFATEPDELSGSSDSVLDALFDSVESTP